MIKHIVSWELNEMPQEQKELHLNEMKSLLLKLKNQIEYIHSLSVGINHINTPYDNFDIVLISEFESIEKLDLYRKHPAHLDFIKKINSYRKRKVAVDFEF